MEREIIFRGKRIDNGEWVEGFYWCNILGNYFIKQVVNKIGFFDIKDHEIEKETVGQYTGLKDSTGKRIFEGDILEFNDFGEEGFDFANTASVVFVNGRFKLENFLYDDGGVMEEMKNNHDEFVGALYDSKIIGNIHDNNKLLEVE